MRIRFTATVWSMWGIEAPALEPEQKQAAWSCRAVTQICSAVIHADKAKLAEKRIVCVTSFIHSAKCLVTFGHIHVNV